MHRKSSNPDKECSTRLLFLLVLFWYGHCIVSPDLDASSQALDLESQVQFLLKTSVCAANSSFGYSRRITCDSSVFNAQVIVDAIFLAFFASHFIKTYLLYPSPGLGPQNASACIFSPSTDSLLLL